jgi:hypothetical protein
MTTSLNILPTYLDASKLSRPRLLRGQQDVRMLLHSYTRLLLSPTLKASELGFLRPSKNHPQCYDAQES